MSNKNKVGRVYIPASGVATNKNKHNEGSPLIRLTGDEFATTAESALYNLNDINSDNGGGVLTNNGTVTFAHDSDLGETVGTYNGSSQYLSRATEAQFEVGTGSFTASIQFKTTVDDTGYDTLFSYGSAAVSKFWAVLLGQNGQLYSTIQDGSVTLNVVDPIANRWNDGKWHTVTMMVDTSLATDTSFLWVDGQLIGSTVQALGTLTIANEEMRIGAWKSSGGAISNYFEGQLANFHLIKSADYNAVQVLNQGTREAVCVDANTVGFGLYTETSSRLNNLFENGSGASNGDYITTVIDVEEGLYEIQRLYIKQSTIGIVEMLIDDVLVHSVDEYNSSTTFNNLSTVKDIALSGGKHILKLKTNGTSGSDYRIKFNFINIIKRDGHENGGATEFLLLGDEINQRENAAVGFAATPTYFYNSKMFNTNGLDSEYSEGDLFLKGGLWRIDFIYEVGTAGGKIDFDFGNVEILDQFDTYGSASANAVKTVNVKLNQGKNNIRIASNGKNASSSSYHYVPINIRGIRIGN
tara:strand:- start:1389 stop:2963 length:1575 start_codon:yes stop_codon:yes gene_type:complete